MKPTLRGSLSVQDQPRTDRVIMLHESILQVLLNEHVELRDHLEDEAARLAHRIARAEERGQADGMIIGEWRKELSRLRVRINLSHTTQEYVEARLNGEPLR